MLPRMNVSVEEEGFQQACDTLPRMTAFLMDDLETYALRQRLRSHGETDAGCAIRHAPPAATATVFVRKPPSGCQWPLPVAHSEHVSTSNDQWQRVRSLIFGISEYFNDLLMGIWGNSSLIKMQLPRNHEAHKQIDGMETLIQEGGFLVHLILGFLGERRQLAKRIKLDQLIQEIDQHIPGACSKTDYLTYLQSSTLSMHLPQIAGNVARVLNLLLNGIMTFRRRIDVSTQNLGIIQKRVSIIADLTARGELLIHQLLCYAGELKLSKRKINPGRLLAERHRTAAKRFNGLQVRCFIDPELPLILADRNQIGFVLDQLIDNAGSALHHGGCLNLAVKCLQAEAPHERCGVHIGDDYVVMSVEDNGRGIPKSEQSRIFDPFYAYPQPRTGKGLGLTAAKGVAKLHGGYIQFRSVQGMGSTFRLYLPIHGNCGAL